MKDGRCRDAPPADDDASLLRRVREQDVAAFEQLYRRHHTRLSRFILGIVKAPEKVEEVLNDTMLVLWERPESFRGDSRLSTWLFGIAYRKAMKARSRLDPAVEDPEQDTRASLDPDPEMLAGERRTGIALGAALDRLSPAHRAVVDLTYAHELGYREIADIVGCPVDTVKTRMFHARKHLKSALGHALSDWI